MAGRRSSSPAVAPAELLQAGVTALNLELGPEACRLFLLYLEELQKWNTRLNLTGLRTPTEIVCKHFLDSLAVWPWTQDLETLADLGTGAGFPGLPLKILRPDLRLTLVEATGKKVAFLKFLVWKLGLKGVEIKQLFLTPASFREWPVRFQGLITRATWSPGRFVELAGPLAEPGGCLLSLKGPHLRREEWQEAQEAARRRGWPPPTKIAYLVPVCDLPRHLLRWPVPVTDQTAMEDKHAVATPDHAGR